MKIDIMKCADCGTMVALLHPNAANLDERRQFETCLKLYQKAAVEPVLLVGLPNIEGLGPSMFIASKTDAERVLAILQRGIDAAD